MQGIEIVVPFIYLSLIFSIGLFFLQKQLDATLAALEDMKGIKESIKHFLSGEETKRMRVTKMYTDKLAEVEEKFKAFQAELSAQVAHSTFYKEAQLPYYVNIGAGGELDIDVFLHWLKGIALPPGSTASGSGFLSSVKTAEGQPALQLSDASSSSSTSKEDELATFLSGANLTGSSSIGALQVSFFIIEIYLYIILIINFFSFPNRLYWNPHQSFLISPASR